MQTIADLIAAGNLTAYKTRKGAVHLIAVWRAAYPRITRFWSAAAFAQRGRDRERRKLVCELEGLDEQARYDKGRRPMLTERLQILAREDMAATLAGYKASVCANSQVLGRIKRAPLPDGSTRQDRITALMRQRYHDSRTLANGSPATGYGALTPSSLRHFAARPLLGREEFEGAPIAEQEYLAAFESMRLL